MRLDHTPSMNKPLQYSKIARCNRARRKGWEPLIAGFKEAGPLQPERFELVETNERLAALQQPFSPWRL